MSFVDPQSVTISATPHTLPRVSSGENAGSFSKDDGSIAFTVTQAYGKRNRRAARLSHSKYAADPLFPTQNTPYSMSVTLSVDVPKVGYTIAEQKAVVDGFIANLNATLGANLTKLLGGES
jgi:hypothetical protein